MDHGVDHGDELLVRRGGGERPGPDQVQPRREPVGGTGDHRTEAATDPVALDRPTEGSPDGVGDMGPDQGIVANDDAPERPDVDPAPSGAQPLERRPVTDAPDQADSL